MTPGPISSLLVANRGEIALRVARTSRRLGIRAVGVYTPADAGARHVRELDEVVALARDDSYLDPAAVVSAAERAGCDAVHPGYGFLAENPALARACADAGLVFVGPSAEVIALMGDKLAARAAAAAAGVPVLPGTEPGLGHDELRAAAREVGFPLLVKPAAGGGGKGMHLVQHASELDAALELARSEAGAAFGDGTVFLERYVARARHVEIQVLADNHGTVLHLGERDCSLQRRHQKVVEAAPAPALDQGVRRSMCGRAVELARSCGYTGVGTVELIVPSSGEEWFFLEMNTRLQVEHRVTELVWGVDLVELQLRVAAGEALAVGQHELAPKGCAVEARLYAEDPDRGFLPSAGRLLALRLPEATPAGLSCLPGWRGPELGPSPGAPAGLGSEPAAPVVLVDSGVEAGDVVGTEYDPLLAKVVVWAPDRRVALARLQAELRRSAVLGVASNLELVTGILGEGDVRSGIADTGLVEHWASSRVAARGHGADRDGEALLVAGALALHLASLDTSGEGPWDDAGSWRTGAPAWSTVRLASARSGEQVVRWRGRVGARPGGSELAGEVRLGDGPAQDVTGQLGGGRTGGARLVLVLDGLLQSFDVAVTEGAVWVARNGRSASFSPGATAPPAAAETGASGVLRSPMPGVVRRVAAEVGSSVRAGQVLVVVEAMKMQHPVPAPARGSVAEMRVAEGDSVELDQVLAVLTPAAPPAGARLEAGPGPTGDPRLEMGTGTAAGGRMEL